jgi:hypothetical protein
MDGDPVRPPKKKKPKLPCLHKRLSIIEGSVVCEKCYAWLTIEMVMLLRLDRILSILDPEWRNE